MDESIVAKRLASDWALTGIDSEGQALTLGIVLTGEDRIVGDVMLRFHSAVHRSGEIGWILNPKFSGRGLATEAAHALLHLCFEELGLHRVIARVESENESSRRLAARLGMRQEAELVDNEWFKGRWSSEVDFAMLEDEWRENHSAR